MYKYNDIIGLIGGFGGYATLDFYRRLLETFAGDSERDFPHIMMDNNFAMPSRTRALLYNEDIPEITHKIAKSIRMLYENGANKIIFVCGTAHYFMEGALAEVPEARPAMISIVKSLCQKLKENKVGKVVLLAAEGCLLKNVYDNDLLAEGIEIIKPTEEQWPELRYFIECTKRNQIDEKTSERFVRFLRYMCVQDSEDVPNIILGCTELPAVAQATLKKISLDKTVDTMFMQTRNFWDPLEAVLDELKRTLQ